MDVFQKSLELHKAHCGKLAVESKVPLETREDLSLSYTPGVAEPCRKIFQNPEDAYIYTMKANTVAVITDGSAVLGLGNIGALAGLPVMEGKCQLLKKFGGVDAIPICVKTQNPREFIDVVKNITPGLGAINLEDISAPRCFEIEECLKKELDIPVFHDDQHGTAIVVLAGLINALKITDRRPEEVKVVISGAGAAGTSVSRLMLDYGIKNIIVCDRLGALNENRADLLKNAAKLSLAKITNPNHESGSLEEVIKGADVFVGVSAPNLLSKEMVSTMSPKSIVFALANPTPEIMPDDAIAGGAYIVATGRSDYPNQINNVLAFPGIFRGVLDIRAKQITDKMKLSAAMALANLVTEPSPQKIIPGVFDLGVAEAVAEAVKKEAMNLSRQQRTLNTHEDQPVLLTTNC